MSTSSSSKKPKYVLRDFPRCTKNVNPGLLQRHSKCQDVGRRRDRNRHLGHATRRSHVDRISTAGGDQETRQLPPTSFNIRLNVWMIAGYKCPTPPSALSSRGRRYPTSPEEKQGRGGVDFLPNASIFLTCPGPDTVHKYLPHWLGTSMGWQEDIRQNL